MAGWTQRVLREFTVACPEDRQIEHHEAWHYFELKDVTAYDRDRGKVIQLFDSLNGQQWSGLHPMSRDAVEALRDALTEILERLEE